MPTKSPHRFSRSACLNSSRPIDHVRCTLNLLFSVSYSSWFHRMSSPRCSIVGFDSDVLAMDVEVWETDAGGGRPESCGVGVAADIVVAEKQ